MNGIFSGQPCQSSIRLLVGTHLLLLVQSSILLWSGSDLGKGQALVWVTLLLGVSAFICAVRGDDGERRPYWRRRSNGR